MSTQKGKNLYYGLQMAIPMLFFVVASISPMFIRLVVDVSNGDYISTTVKLLIMAGATFYVIPVVIGIPERDGGHVNLVRIGLRRKGIDKRELALGVLLGVTSLTFMLIGSLIAGGYSFDPSTIDPEHIYFSLFPGIFEEVVFRGIIMVVCLKQFRDMKKAVAFQIFLFTISHLKDFSIVGIVDMLTVAVIALAFTYVVYRTGHLYTAMIFHFINDAFLFTVQKDAYVGFFDNFAFYGSVWAGMAVICGLTLWLVKPKTTTVYRNALML